MSKPILACNVIHAGKSYKRGDKAPVELVDLFEEKGFFDEAKHAPKQKPEEMSAGRLKSKYPGVHDEIFERGRKIGFDEGEAEGFRKGRTQGYNDGHEAGLAEGMKATPASTSGAPQVAVLDGKVDEIKAALPSCSDDELEALLEEEEQGKNRKGVLDAINAELDSREDGE